jgi:integrase
MNIFKKKIKTVDAIDQFVKKTIIENRSLTDVTKNTSQRLFKTVRLMFNDRDTLDKLNYAKLDEIKTLWEKKGIKSSTIRMRMSALRRLVYYFYSMEMISKKIAIPKINSAPKQEVTFYTKLDYKKIIGAIKNETKISNLQRSGYIYSERAYIAEKLYYSIRVLAETGIRPCEFLRLKFSDIDFINKKMTIKAFSLRKGPARTIPISDKLVSELKSYKGTHSTVYVSPWYDKDKGIEQQQADFTRCFLSLCKRNKLHLTGGKYKVRQFRSSFATWALESGIPTDYVFRYLGHSNSSTIARHYVNSNRVIEKQQNNIRKMKRLLIS